MTFLEINTKEVLVKEPDLKLSAYLAYPKDSGNYPGIVVLQEVFGVNEHIEDITRKIAGWGYIAIAPALFSRQVTGFSVGYSPQELAQGREYAMKTKTSELLSDIQASINYLKNLPNINNKFGCIGFCYGGHVAYLAATLPDISKTASFYGRGIPLFTFGEGEPSITRTKDIHGEISLFFGTEDTLIPVTEIDQVEEALKTANINYQMFRYPGAEHGFCCDRRPSFHPPSADDAWLKVQNLFQQLNPPERPLNPPILGDF